LYGFYVDRRPFWEGFGDLGFFDGDNGIIEGNLNLTLNQRDILGEITRKYVLAIFFIHFFEVQNLIDVEQVKLVPTWRNSRRGRSGISKSLD